jgi:hypothetical protein
MTQGHTREPGREVTRFPQLNFACHLTEKSGTDGLRWVLDERTNDERHQDGMNDGIRCGNLLHPASSPTGNILQGPGDRIQMSKV